MPLRSSATIAVLLAAIAGAAGPARQVRPGVWSASSPVDLPLPATGYQVYVLGEMHGFSQNASAGLAYFEKLHRQSGLRDVAIEEDAVYQLAAEAYVDGRAGALPPGLCLRSEALEAFRNFNRRRAPGDRVRVHLVDIDSPASPIRDHLLSVRQRARATVALPDENAIRTQGLAAVAALRRAVPAAFHGELRTIEHSICALLAGLEVGVGTVNGSPYLDDREAAIAANISDLLALPGARGVLAMYGSDHASRRLRRDGGPQRNAEFAPLALRLENAGIKVFSLIHFPLGGRWLWRGRTGGLFWAAADAALEDAEPLDRVFSGPGSPNYVYVDASRHRVRVPSDDVMGFRADAFLLLREGVPMADRCAAH
jgi:hypothetical protein